MPNLRGVWPLELTGLLCLLFRDFVCREPGQPVGQVSLFPHVVPMFPFRLLPLPMGPLHVYVPRGVVTLVRHTSSSFLTGYLSFLGKGDSFVSSLVVAGMESSRELFSYGVQVAEESRSSAWLSCHLAFLTHLLWENHLMEGLACRPPASHQTGLQLGAGRFRHSNWPLQFANLSGAPGANTVDSPPLHHLLQILPLPIVKDSGMLFHDMMEQHVQGVRSSSCNILATMHHTGVQWGNGYMESIPMCCLLLY